MTEESTVILNFIEHVLTNISSYSRRRKEIWSKCHKIYKTHVMMDLTI